MDETAQLRVLNHEFGRYPRVFRPDDVQPTYLPLMFVGILIAMLVVVYIFAKGYEGGTAVVEGARFGACFGIFAAAFYANVNYATLNIGRRLAVALAAAGVCEWILAGIVIALVYKPAASAARRAATV